NVFAQIEDGFPENPDNLPAIIGGAVPDQMLAIGPHLVVAYDASDELETFSVDVQAPEATNILTPVNQAFTNGTQTAFPTAINRKAVFDDEPFLLGKDDPDYFRGRMPQGVVFAASTRRLYVANRLGESVTTFSVDENGKPQFQSLIDLTLPNSPL